MNQHITSIEQDNVQEFIAYTSFLSRDMFSLNANNIFELCLKHRAIRVFEHMVMTVQFMPFEFRNLFGLVCKRIPRKEQLPFIKSIFNRVNEEDMLQLIVQNDYVHLFEYNESQQKWFVLGCQVDARLYQWMFQCDAFKCIRRMMLPEEITNEHIQIAIEHRSSQCLYYALQVIQYEPMLHEWIKSLSVLVHGYNRNHVIPPIYRNSDFDWKSVLQIFRVMLVYIYELSVDEQDQIHYYIHAYNPLFYIFFKECIERLLNLDEWCFRKYFFHPLNSFEHLFVTQKRKEIQCIQTRCLEALHNCVLDDIVKFCVLPYI